jgi:ectoine hydroxylase-related dioxygenase (phytanoyl-CoA dioxygenase family)
MWWSLAVPSSVQERSSAAQLYHFDLDRLSFLKFFIYLSDVDVTNGPHCYIAGSHRGFKSVELLRDGRFSDDEIKRHYPNEEVRITGKRGTIFVADTKGFHRGLPLESGERLIFQIEFCNSLFGAPYNKWRRSRAHGDPTEGNPTLFAKLDG